MSRQNRRPGAKHLFVATAGGTVTVAVGAGQVVTLDANTLKAVASVTIPGVRGEATALAAGGGAAWLGTDAGWLYRIDSGAGRVAGARRLGARVLSLSASGRAIWMTTALSSGAYDTMGGHGGGRARPRLPLLRVAADGADVWGILATPRHGDYVARIDPRTRTIAGTTSSPVKAPAFTPDTIGVHAGATWIVNADLQTLTRVG